MGWTDPNATAERLPMRPCFHSGAFRDRRRVKEGAGWEIVCFGLVSMDGFGDFEKTNGLDLAVLCLPLLLVTDETRPEVSDWSLLSTAKLNCLCILASFA